MYSPCDDCTLLQPDSSIRTSAGKGYLLLTAAYRSLSRPSSAPSAKASALCSSWLDQSSAWRSVTSGLLLKLIHSSENFWFSRCKLISKCSFLPSISFKRLCLSNSISFSLLTCLYTIWYYIQFSRYRFALFADWPVSRQSSQRTRAKWWRIRDSNPWPPACKAGALPSELIPHDGWTNQNS